MVQHGALLSRWNSPQRGQSNPAALLWLLRVMCVTLGLTLHTREGLSEALHGHAVADKASTEGLGRTPDTLVDFSVC